MERFELVSDFSPAGDQPEAIDGLVQGIENGLSEQTLLGVTGSGKTYTMAQVIQRVQKPTLILAHNKTLVSVSCIPNSRRSSRTTRVEYFVSNFDYYKPESYHARSTDMYIEKNSDDATTRWTGCGQLLSTCALLERRDVDHRRFSVSCIYASSATRRISTVDIVRSRCAPAHGSRARQPDPRELIDHPVQA